MDSDKRQAEQTGYNTGSEGKIFVWLVGFQGMLGQEVRKQLQEAGIRHEATDAECDITSLEALRSFAEGKRFTHIINCAAYTAVDQAEDEPDTAYALNAIGPKNIAAAAAEIDAVMIHVSTDYVFDGNNANGYQEDDPVNPISVYGKTKAAGEQFIQEVFSRNTSSVGVGKNDSFSDLEAGGSPGYYIVRTAWLYGKYGKNFVSTMLRLMNEREELSVVNDQHGSPTSAADLAAFLLYLVQHEGPFGIYHYINDGQTTWYEFAQEIYRLGRANGLVTSECSIHPVASDQFPTKAVRPKWSRLLRTKCDVLTVGWKSELVEFLMITKKHIQR